MLEEHLDRDRYGWLPPVVWGQSVIVVLLVISLNLNSCLSQNYSTVLWPCGSLYVFFFDTRIFSLSMCELWWLSEWFPAVVSSWMLSECEWLANRWTWEVIGSCDQAGDYKRWLTPVAGCLPPSQPQTPALLCQWFLAFVMFCTGFNMG